jgi:hypothetical protein
MLAVLSTLVTANQVRTLDVLIPCVGKFLVGAQAEQDLWVIKLDNTVMEHIVLTLTVDVGLTEAIQAEQCHHM